MTYTEGLAAGLWLLGALTPLAVLALAALLVVFIDVPHRVRVHRLNRQARRDGRGPARNQGDY